MNTQTFHHDRRRAAWIGVLFALIFPTIVTLAYFVLAASFSPEIQQVTYSAMKGLQFAFPLLWVVLAQQQGVRLARPPWQGVGLGTIFGLVILIAIVGLYWGFLRSMPSFVEAADAMREKISSFGLDSIWKFVVIGIFYSLIHSLLEEYYWRWFVFGQLSRLLPLWPAILLSALGFTAHHVLVLATYFGWFSWMTLLFSLSVTVGGIFWAWLYHRSGSLAGPWVSHLFVDAGIFFVGYLLLV